MTRTFSSANQWAGTVAVLAVTLVGLFHFQCCAVAVAKTTVLSFGFNSEGRTGLGTGQGTYTLIATPIIETNLGNKQRE